MSKLSLTTRKDIQAAEVKRTANLKKITTASGFEFEIEIDWLIFAAACEERGYKDRAGEVVYDWYLGALANSITKLCSDNMSKEAFQESCEKKVIAFILHTGPQEELLSAYCYSQTTFEDGVLKVLIPKERLCSNVGDTGTDMESRL